MSTVLSPPVKDPEKTPNPGFEEPDYNEPIKDPDSDKLPDNPGGDEDNDLPDSDDAPVKVS